MCLLSLTKMDITERIEDAQHTLNILSSPSFPENTFKEYIEDAKRVIETMTAMKIRAEKREQKIAKAC